MIEIFKPGTVCHMGDIEGTITAAAIYAGNRISYQVAWWDGKDRKQEWLDDCEIVVGGNGGAKQQIGFVGGTERD